MGEEEENFFLTCGNSIFFLARTVLSVSYKILLQGITLVLAVKIRKVKIPALDDGRYVAVMVYVATVLVLLVVAASLTLVDFPNAFASVFAASSVIGGVSFLSLLFVPKVSICANKHTETSTSFHQNE